LDIIKKLEWRYAVKKFNADKMLTEEKLEKLKQAFNLTATSYGLQPIKLLVVQNKELQKELVKFTYGQKQVAQASHVLVICIEKQIDQKFIHDYFARVQQIRNTSDEILDPFKGCTGRKLLQKGKGRGQGMGHQSGLSSVGYAAYRLRLGGSRCLSYGRLSANVL
tara:strand:- start:384 stop:878 length:495 start_codon:yes stop_codon:yes gene_type:complete